MQEDKFYSVMLTVGTRGLMTALPAHVALIWLRARPASMCHAHYDGGLYSSSIQP